MQTFLFLLLSALEFSSIFLITMALFRFKIKFYTKEIIGSSILLAIISYILIMILNLQQFSIPIQAFLVILLMIIIFQQRILYGFFISVVGYGSFLSVQAALITVLNAYHIVDFSNLTPESTDGHLIQVGTVAIIYVISWFIRFSNEGFGFELDGHKRKFSTNNIVFLNVTILFVLLISIFSYAYFTHKTFFSFVSFAVVLLILTVITIYLAIRRNKEEFGKND